MLSTEAPVGQGTETSESGGVSVLTEGAGSVRAVGWGMRHTPFPDIGCPLCLSKPTPLADTTSLASSIG